MGYISSRVRNSVFVYLCPFSSSLRHLSLLHCCYPSFASSFLSVFDSNFLKLLTQLTVVGDISRQAFEDRLKLLQHERNQYTIVVEDSGTESRVRVVTMRIDSEVRVLVRETLVCHGAKNWRRSTGQCPDCCWFQLHTSFSSANCKLYDCQPSSFRRTIGLYAGFIKHH